MVKYLNPSPGGLDPERCNAVLICKEGTRILRNIRDKILV
jgi:hypothetical protein